MIAKLTGLVEHIDAPNVILDVQGVGYLICCPTSILAQLKLKQSLSLYTEMQIKDEHITLFGFVDLEQKQWFKLLTSVQGVGGKMALAILGALTVAQLPTAIAAQDSTAFRQVSGIGPKLATRIVNELKDKVANITFAHSKLNLPSHGQPAAASPQNMLADAVSALVNLGFSRSDSYTVVNSILTTDASLSLNDIIKKGLAELSRG